MGSSLRYIVTNVLDSGLDVSKFELQLPWYIHFWTNHIYPTPPLGKDMTQGQFLSGVSQVWIQSFPSLRLVASPRMKNLVCPTIYPELDGE